MKIVKERQKPKGTPIKVAVNTFPGRNSLTIKPESSILKEEVDESKEVRVQPESENTKEEVNKEVPVKEGSSEYKDGGGSCIKRRRPRKTDKKNRTIQKP